jgi:hypothetical protein
VRRCPQALSAAALCGEVLRRIEAVQGAHDKRREGVLLPLTRTKAATEAGLSEHEGKNRAACGDLLRGIDVAKPGPKSQWGASLQLGRGAADRDHKAVWPIAAMLIATKLRVVGWFPGMSVTSR